MLKLWLNIMNGLIQHFMVVRKINNRFIFHLIQVVPHTCFNIFYNLFNNQCNLIQ
jgi:hypothetical protein